MKGSILSHSDADIKDTEVIDINNKLNLNLKLLFRRKSQRHCISQLVFLFSQIDQKTEYRWSMICNLVNHIAKLNSSEFILYKSYKKRCKIYIFDCLLL